MCRNTMQQAVLTSLAVAMLTACAAQDAQQVNLVAQRLLSAAATQTAAAADTTGEPDDPTALPTSEPSPTPVPPLVFARCIVRASLDMRLQPIEGATAVAALKPRDVVTAYGRTEDGAWILAWNRDITYGWLPAGAIGCSAPSEDLRATAPDALLTPEPSETPSPTETATAIITQPAATTPPPPSPLPSPTTTPQPPALEPTIIVRVITVTVIVTVTAPPIVIIATPTPAAAQPTATLLPTPASAPIPDALVCVVTSDRVLNLRSGPNRSFRLVGRLQPGANFFATGRNADQTWLNGVTETGLRAWLIASAVSCQGDARSLPIVGE